MPDNFDFTPGTGAKGASDEIGLVHYPRVKLNWGVEGTAVDASATDPLPVNLGAAVKAASTAPLATDAALVVSVSPNSPSMINAADSVSGTTTSSINDTTPREILPAAGADLRYYITNIIVGNGDDDVGTFVYIRDGANTMYAIPAAAAFGGASLAFPIPLRQPTLNTNILAQCGTTGAQVHVSISGYKAA
jgi:hypothetical protein